MKKKESADEKLMYEIAQENKRMSAPLKRALEDVERLRKELNEYKRVKEKLRIEKAGVSKDEAKLKALTWEHEVLLQRFEILQQERTELYDNFQASVAQVHQRASLKHLLLEKKLTAVEQSK